MSNDQRNDRPEGVDRNDPTRIEEAVAEYVDALISGKPLDRMQVLLDNPGIGHEILERLESFVGVESHGTTGVPLGTLGDYTLRRQIGRGGMGVVYEAWENSMNRCVALKVLPAGIAADRRAYARFMREAQAAGQLNHPNLVPVHAAGFKENTPYYAMELIDGDTLAQILATLRAAGGKEEEKQRTLLGISRLLGKSESAEPTAKPERVNAEGEQAETSTKRTPFGADDQDLVYYGNLAKAFAGVAEGLQHAHARKIIHRDIKPSNLILDREGRLRILDFGLARLEGQESLTVSGDFVGTPLYMSPEQARARKIPIDHRTDIYSLGATIYEMLTYRPPFKGRNHQDTLSQIIDRDPVEPRKLNQRVPKDLETIVLKCLRKDPGDRYGTAEALSQDLRRIVRGDPIEARPQSAWEKLVRRVRRHKARVGTIACVFLLLVTLALLVGQRLQEDYRRDYKRREMLYDRTVREAASRLLVGQLRFKWDAGDRGMLLGSAHDLLGARPGQHPVEEALAKLHDAVTLFPNRVEAHYYRAKGNLFLGRERLAAEDLTRALSCDWSFLPAVLLQANLFARTGQPIPPALAARLSARQHDSGWGAAFLAAHRALAERRFAEAAKAYGRLIATDRANRESYLGSGIAARMGRGIALLEGGKFKAAIRDFVVALDRWPELVEPALFLGKAYYLDGDEEEAEAIFASFYHASARSDRAALAIASVYRQLGGYDRGLAWIRSIADPHMRDRSQAILLCCTAKRIGGFDLALAHGLRALTQHPDDARLYTYLRTAVWSLASDELSRHRLACQDLLSRYPRNPYVHVLLGTIENELQNYGEAIRLYKQAIHLDRLNVDAYLGLSRTYSKAHQFAEHAEILRKIVTELAPPVEAEPGRPWYARLGDSRRDTRAVWAWRYAQMAQVLIEDQRKCAEAKKLCDRALRLNPRSVYALLALGGVLSREGDYDQAIRVLERALDVYPWPITYVNLAVAQQRSGDFKGAIGAYHAAMEIDPTWERAEVLLAGLLDRSGEMFDESTLDACLELVRDLASSDKRPPKIVRILSALASLLARHALREGYEEDAFWCAHLGVKESGRQDPDALGALAKLLRIRGDYQQAILLMEEALALSRCKHSLVEELAAAREEMLPRLVSYASVDEVLSAVDRGDLAPKGFETDNQLLDAFRVTVENQEGERILVYLEGRTLQRAGEYTPAAKIFAQLAKTDAQRPQPHLRYAENLRDGGDPLDAVTYLHGVLSSGLAGSKTLWNLWLAIALNELQLAPGEILARFPTADVEEGPVDGHSRSVTEGRYAGDVRWLLKTLSAGEAIRINCGGGVFEDSASKTWSRDRFFSGGSIFGQHLRRPLRFGGDIAGTDDDLLYQTERWFPQAEWPLPSYRIPVRPGRYRVRLYFAEIFHLEPGQRVFHVEIEDKRVLPSYEPFRRGFATADSYEFDTTVVDRFLDVMFIHDTGSPKISAIQVEVLE